MKPIIRVENLSKQYKIGTQQKPYSTLRESLTDAVRAPFKRFGRDREKKQNSFWALKDVSFEVNPGEVVGIIGRNGAGKSTLLKILSRITEPTTGKVELYGRVGSLLEVGTGFHHELTGRENIFLNGAILGMKREEIAKKFDEIVDFAEVEQFLDTPVKHYSSGMYMRLAFAVAANLESEILVVDEVLAVGDADFQKKCLGKMRDISEKKSRTVLFVSHSLTAITNLCSRCILLNKGEIVKDGSVSESVALYQSSNPFVDEISRNLNDVERTGTGKAKFTFAEWMTLGKTENTLQPGDNLNINLKIAAYQKIAASNVAIIVYDFSGYRLIDANIALQGSFLNLEGGQEAGVKFTLKNLLLKPGVYTIGLWLGQASIEEIDSIPYALNFTVVDSHQSKHTQVYPGVYQCDFSYNLEILCSPK